MTETTGTIEIELKDLELFEAFRSGAEFTVSMDPETEELILIRNDDNHNG